MTNDAAPARSELIAEARRWAGRPYNPSGGQACGANCLGLFVGILREVGGLETLVAAAEPYLGYAKPPAPRALLNALKRHLIEIKPQDAEPGDLLLFKAGGQPQHLAIMTEVNVILHADARRWRVVEHRLPESWRAVAAFRIEALA